MLQGETRTAGESRTGNGAGPVYWFTAALAGTLVRAVARRDWRGRHHLPASGGYITAVNHTSYADPFSYGLFQYHSGRPARFLGKAPLFSVPVLGAALRSMGHIPVRRRTSRASDALVHAKEALARGCCVAVYPEGTFTDDPELWPSRAKTGVARLALETGAPVIPVAQWNAHELIPAAGSVVRRSRPWYRRTVLRVTAGPPVDLSDLRGLEITAPVLEEAGLRIMDAITTLLEELREEPRPARKSRPTQEAGPDPREDRRAGAA
ncbi:1-acyl-sn-glycerol-3-phosphate acyltransferase [Streptomyces sp. UH6]|uniref:lysophospholipid acyltransferase family protein n=1 Tax=Streptomyces sp. UH6 TaxID=2748379 RepID=UPI0015D48319|nr:lysophospholipid acyltransferase family protein [Streptomyces sp. UH6]NYV73550.1 1-acyl-sn-glycerol-3-phosphate acyltransferase [Streptomyces sp. UH6]